MFPIARSPFIGPPPIPKRHEFTITGHVVGHYTSIRKVRLLWWTLETITTPMLVVQLDEEERTKLNREFRNFPRYNGEDRLLQKQIKVEVPGENGVVGDYPRSTEVELTLGYSYSNWQTIVVVQVAVRQFTLRFEEAA